MPWTTSLVSHSVAFFFFWLRQVLFIYLFLYFFLAVLGFRFCARADLQLRQAGATHHRGARVTQ